MSALLVDSATVADLVHADSVLGARVALGTLVFCLGQALAIAEGRDPELAGLEALKQVRRAIGVDVAEIVAKRQDVETEQAIEDAEQVERERAFEASVSWGRE